MNQPQHSQAQYDRADAHREPTVKSLYWENTEICGERGHGWITKRPFANCCFYLPYPSAAGTTAGPPWTAPAPRWARARSIRPGTSRISWCLGSWSTGTRQRWACDSASRSWWPNLRAGLARGISKRGQSIRFTYQCSPPTSIVSSPCFGSS